MLNPLIRPAGGCRRLPLRFLSLLCVATLAVPAVAQEEKEKERDPKLPEKIEQFEDAIQDKKFARDAEAVTLVEQFAQRYADLHEKDQREVVKAIRNVFRVKPRKPEDPRLYEATITAFGTIGGETGSRELAKLYDAALFTRDKDEWVSTREKILENVGRTKDEKQIDFLLKEATRSPIDNLMRAAGYALRYFADSDGKVRHDIVNKMLIKYGQVQANAESSLDTNNGQVAAFRARLNAIQGSWNQTLSALTGANLRTAPQWQDWWNDNKNNRDVWK